MELVAMGRWSAEVRRVRIGCEYSTLPLCSKRKGTLGYVVRDFDGLVIHAFPNDLEWLFPFDPFFDDDHPVSGQDGEDNLTGVDRVLKGCRAREGLLDGAVLGVGGAGDRIVKITFRH